MMRDSDLAAALRRREEDALALCLSKYARLLWPIAAAVLQGVGGDADVEECVADVFISLWEHPEKWEPERGSLKSYLCIVARSRAMDRRRRLLRQTALPLEEAAQLAADLGLQEALLRREDRLALRAAVDALEEPGREAVLRRYYCGQKPRQIALAMGLTPKQVTNALFRARAKLRKTLTDMREVEA